MELRTKIEVVVTQEGLKGYLLEILPPQFLRDGYGETVFMQPLPFTPGDVISGLVKQNKAKGYTDFAFYVGAADTGQHTIRVSARSAYYFRTREEAGSYQGELIEWVHGEGSKLLRRRVEEALRKNPACVQQVAKSLGLI
jgi:hypothetical protein